MRHVTAATRNQGNQRTGNPTKLFQSASVAHPGSRCRDNGAGGPRNQAAFPGALVRAARGRSAARQGVRNFGPTRRTALRFVSLALVAIVFAVGFASSAFAAETHPYTGTSFGPDGVGGTETFENLQSIAVDQASGEVFAYDAGAGAIYKFTAAGEPEYFSALGTTVIENVGGSGGGENQIAVAPAGAPGGTAGDIYVASYGAPGIRVYSAGGDPLGEFGEGGTCGVATDPAGHIFTGTYPETIREYVPSANPPLSSDVSGTSTASLSSICNVASDGLGNVYAAGYSEGPVVKLEGLADTSATTLDPTANTLAVDPATDDVYTNRRSKFAQYSSGGDLIGTSGSELLSNSQGIAVDGTTNKVYAATRPTGRIAIFGAAEPFGYIAAPQAAAVTATEATLSAGVNPNGLATTYQFEYGTDPSYGNATQTKSIGSDEAFHPVSIALSGLLPGTTYHWRVTVNNSSGSVHGPDQTFTTYSPAFPDTNCPNQSLRTGASSGLPDCRAYEMVSPVDKNGGDIVPLIATLNYTSNLVQSSLDGNKVTYTSYKAFGNSEGAPYANQYIGTRDSQSGWATESISPKLNPSNVNSVVLTVGFELSSLYAAFSPDLSDSWFKYFGEVPLVPGAPPGLNFYRRENPSGALEPLIEVEREKLANFQAFQEGSFMFQGASADSTAELFSTRGTLTADSAAEVAQLYLHKDGSLHLVCILPDGTASAEPCSAGTPNGAIVQSVDGAISADGSRVYWSDEVGDAFVRPGELYLRKNPAKPQSAISGGECTEPQKACTLRVSGLVPNTGEAWFWDASANGEKALFSVSTGPFAHPLTGEELYEFDAGSGKASLIAGGLKGVVGISDDAAYVYFVSTEPLAPGAIDGGQNFYLRHEGAISLVAVLSSEDVGSEYTSPSTHPSNIEVHNPYRVARVAPDGRHIVFVSDRPLTGYDNSDARSGKPDREVYSFEVGSSGPICISCNPAGTRPVGKLVSGIGVSNAGTPVWTAATTPGWAGDFHPTRPLTDDGSRIVFDSYDGLLPQDSNGKEDVYEWLAVGSHGCDAGSPLFHAVNQGCLGLISSGESPTDSELADMSPDGRDVFFTTSSSLLPQDPGLVDIYDARSDGGFPPPPTPAASCEGEACQGPLAAPNDPTPSSLTFNGAGNVKKKATHRKHRKKAHKKHRKRAHNKKQKAKDSPQRARDAARGRAKISETDRGAGQ